MTENNYLRLRHASHDIFCPDQYFDYILIPFRDRCKWCVEKTSQRGVSTLKIIKIDNISLKVYTKNVENNILC